MHKTMTMHSLFADYAAAQPDTIAIIQANQALSYGELNHQANQLAHFLHKSGVKPNTLIAVSMQRSPELIICILGILKAGCAWLPLDDTHPVERLNSLLQDARPAALITQSSSADKFQHYQGKRVLLDQDWASINTYPAHNPAPIGGADHLAYVIYTSGSTGHPKGVQIDHKSLVNYINWFGEYSGCKNQDRIDFSSNYIFDIAITASVAALALGLQVVICPEEIKKNTRHYLEYLVKQKINITKLTPSYFKLLLQETSLNQVDLPDLKSIILGGENLLTADCKHWLASYPAQHLHNEYGPTETTVAVTQFQLTCENINELGAAVPIGKPGFNIECMLLSEDLQTPAAGEIGELYISGFCLARGYLYQPQLTAERFLIKGKAGQRWYKTGDLCRYLPDGCLEYCKRVDDQVKIHGYRIEPAEIETCLATYPQIKQAVVISHEQQLTAYYLSRDMHDPPSHHALRHHLRQQLVDYMVPANFVMLAAFPLTANGKLDKNALPRPALPQHDDDIQPVSTTEQVLVDIWREEFHQDHIGINNNFFELGGHSLLAARIAALIEKYLIKKIKLEDIYQSENIRQLAVMVEAADTMVKDPEISSPSLKTSTSIPLSDFQFMYWIANVFEPKVNNINLVMRKRLSGKLDIHALYFAFSSLFKKHDVLLYGVSTLLPVQKLKHNYTFKLIETDLSHADSLMQEAVLTTSLNKLLSHPFKKQVPKLAASLFYLDNNISELQISVAHTAFDNASENILFSELSHAYLQYMNGMTQHLVERSHQYKHYVLHERSQINRDIVHDVDYWENYLRDADLVTLPASAVIKDMAKENIPYSTYLKLAPDFIPALKAISADYRVNVTDIVCAAIAITIQELTGKINQDKIMLNIVKSTRDHALFDNMIGCFLRIDPVKIDINTSLSLPDLSRAIQQSRIDTAPHQHCSGMVKLACLNKNFRQKPFREYFVNKVAALYSSLFKNLALNSKMLAMYYRLNDLRSERKFLINVNILNNFINHEADTRLFGHRIIKPGIHQYDMSNFDNFLDICLLRDGDADRAYLVISGNLTEKFRSQFGREMMRQLSVKTSHRAATLIPAQD